MYGVEWLIGLALLGLAAGLGGGYLLGNRTGSRAGRIRRLESDLESSRQELADYRREVVSQFSETARKFQTLNDSYTDLHRQLARSSSILCGDVTGPLLAAPSGHQDLIAPEVREQEPDTSTGAYPPPPTRGEDHAEEQSAADGSGIDPAGATPDPEKGDDPPREGDQPTGEAPIRVAEPRRDGADGDQLPAGEASASDERPDAGESPDAAGQPSSESRRPATGGG